MAVGGTQRKKLHRVQSAIEYLTAYGWALAAITVVLGIMFSLGVFTPHSVANACVADTGYLCQGQVLGSTGNLSILFAQTTGAPITVTGISCTAANSTTTPSITPLSGNLVLQSGNQVGLTFRCTSAAGPIGKSFSGYLWIQYNSGSQTGLVSRIAVISTQVSELRNDTSTSITSSTSSTSSSSTTSTFFGPTFNLTYGGLMYFRKCSAFPSTSPPYGQYPEAQNSTVDLSTNLSANCYPSVWVELNGSLNQLNTGIFNISPTIICPGILIGKACQTRENITVNRNMTVITGYTPLTVPVAYNAIGPNSCISAAAPSPAFGTFNQNTLENVSVRSGVPAGCRVAAWNVSVYNGADKSCSGFTCDLLINTTTYTFNYCNTNCGNETTLKLPPPFGSRLEGIQVAFASNTSQLEYIGYFWPGCDAHSATPSPTFGVYNTSIGSTVTLTANPPPGCAVIAWDETNIITSNALGGNFIADIGLFNYTLCNAFNNRNWCSNSESIPIIGNKTMVAAIYLPITSDFMWQGNSCISTSPSPPFGTYAENSLNVSEFIAYGKAESGNAITFYANPGASCFTYNATEYGYNFSVGNGVSCSGESCQMTFPTRGVVVCGFGNATYTSCNSFSMNIPNFLSNRTYVNYQP